MNAGKVSAYNRNEVLCLSQGEKTTREREREPKKEKEKKEDGEKDNVKTNKKEDEIRLTKID